MMILKCWICWGNSWIKSWVLKCGFLLRIWGSLRIWFQWLHVQFCCFKTTLGRFISSVQAWITWFWVRMVIWQNLCVEKLRFGEDFEKSSNCSYSWCFLMVFNLLKDYPKMLGLLVETLESNFEFKNVSSCIEFGGWHQIWLR